MISKKFCDIIRIYVKNIPWFISDVMAKDLHWSLDQLENIGDGNLTTLSRRWKAYIQRGAWKIVESDFWTLPFDFTYMAKVDRHLYNQLAEAKCIFFKGKREFINYKIY